jgi:Flp pilus assembly protein TadD
LALFKSPEPAATVAAPPSEKPAAKAKKSMNDLPAGAGPLVAEARRDFAARRYEDAEKKYLQVLSMDEKNVFTLGNLAAIQLERGRMEDAEANLKKALALEPNDPFNLSLWGILKFRQAKYNEAFDALSLAVKFDPKNPETQNYLGITLSQKGQRQAAESALREAIRLSPDYASAHYNLAVVYATQKPPFLELARYHYRKALSSGHGRNAEFEKVIEGKK